MLLVWTFFRFQHILDASMGWGVLRHNEMSNTLVFSCVYGVFAGLICNNILRKDAHGTLTQTHCHKRSSLM